ncbi:MULTISPECIES: ribonuclease E activity regulator RraA [unclassified Pseudonocardia]|uniref:ribonuclease E activity regulator RraA n=1 Tax=unclassified Pseudonocardia TaxID=2619320 RepID=UPI0001FFDC92|nr:ribonuclease E activity regulator RraA [Pseudonocardia sp. Ae707_Ps1]OLM19964.1 Ribonuclease E inhibitor RraA [Pseudonocardia sp. Ae707_Ps1]
MPTSSPATADLADEYGDSLYSSDTQFRQYGGRAAFGGAAVTLLVHDDNLLVKEAVSEPGAGKVLVIDGGGSCHSALLGDNMAAKAAANGWEGIIVHGAVRDVTALRGLDIGIKAVGSNPRRSGKTGSGRRDVTIALGGATITPGAHIVSDDDGIVVLPHGR